MPWAGPLGDCFCGQPLLPLPVCQCHSPVDVATRHPHHLALSTAPTPTPCRPLECPMQAFAAAEILRQLDYWSSDRYIDDTRAPILLPGYPFVSGYPGARVPIDWPSDSALTLNAVITCTGTSTTSIQQMAMSPLLSGCDLVCIVSMMCAWSVCFSMTAAFACLLCRWDERKWIDSNWFCHFCVPTM